MAVASGPDTPHPDYAVAAADWQRCRDAYAGESAVTRAGERYLARPASMSEADYQAYVDYPTWYAAYGRTIDGLAGAAFRVEPTLDLPTAIAADLQRDATLTGRSLVDVARALFVELLTVGRAGVLVDHTTDAAPAQRPYFRPFTAEQILSWQTETVAGVDRLTRVVLREDRMVPDGAWSLRRVPALLVIAFDTTGAVLMRLFTWQAPARAGEQGQWLEERSIVPPRAGAPLTEIPFVFVGPVMPTRPPLLDLATLNIGHFRVRADFLYGAMKTSRPTVCLFGVSAKEKLTYTPSQALLLPAEARAEILEYKGSGLDTLTGELDRLEAQMAAIGARVLAPPKLAAETAETTRIKTSGETALLSVQAGVLDEAMTAVLRQYATWAGVTGDVSFRLGRDFIAARLSAQDITALVQAFQAGAMDADQLAWNLREGERLPPVSVRAARTA